MPESCVRCANAIPEEQIERNEATRGEEGFLCPICVAKLRIVETAVCPRCGARERPLFDGVTALCRRCGADLPHAHAAPPGPRDAAAPAARPSAPRARIALAASLVAAVAAGVALWRARPPEAPAPASPPDPLLAISQEMGALRRDVQAARAAWDKRLADLAAARAAPEDAAPPTLAIEAQLEALAREIALLRRRSEEMEERLDRRAPPAPPPAPAASNGADPAEREATLAFQALQVRRAALVARGEHAAALAALEAFSTERAGTAAGREADALIAWERRNIAQNLYPLEKDRAEALAAKGQVEQALAAYRDMERRLGIPETIPAIRDRIMAFEARRGVAPRAPDGAALPSEETLRSWLADFRAIPKASDAVERFARAGAQAVPTLIGALDDADPAVRRGAAMALAKIGDRRATAALADRLDDPDPWNRQVYATALGEMKDPAAAPALIERLSGEDLPTARAAYEALVLLSGRMPSLPFSADRGERETLALFWKGWLEEID